MDGDPAAPASAQDRHFDSVYAAHGAAVLGYTVRRCATRDDAVDAAAETFLVAWRKRDQLPTALDEALPWLFTTARWVLAEQARRRVRDDRLGRRLAEDLARDPSAAPDPARLHDVRSTHTAVAAALARLAPVDRELVLLVAWDGLSPSAAGSVLGWGPSRARVRLHRARTRLRNELDVAPIDPPTTTATAATDRRTPAPAGEADA